ncbi:MAG: M20 family metallopeptidase [Oscillospiraceae bacterium]|nr:M20 family metallopeptidase [Oscillospiraceae bacterium]
MWEDCKELQSYLVTMRRELHQIPELGLHLPQTQAYVMAKLDEYGVPYQKSGKDSSLIATITGGKPGKTVALRADMDALPIQEDTGVSYRSKHDGCMHACGHDTHTAMLLGAAKVLNAHKSALCGTVRLIFQTAEELAKGAPIVVENGGVDGVDAIFGTHIGTIISKNIPSGTIIVCPGPIMASFDRFIIKVKGLGCHGSTPEKGIDPVNIAAHIVLGLEAISARELSACVPNVLTIGSIHGGSQYNIIPNDVVIEGTTRSLNEEVRQTLAKRIAEISAAMAAAFGGSVECTMDWGAPPVTNDDEMAALAASCAKEIVGDEMVITSVESPNMGGEDFAIYLQKVPGAFMFLSSANAAKHTDGPHHNPKFNVDEDVLWEGSALFVRIAEKFLSA